MRFIIFCSLVVFETLVFSTQAIAMNLEGMPESDNVDDRRDWPAVPPKVDQATEKMDDYLDNLRFPMSERQPFYNLMKQQHEKGDWNGYMNTMEDALDTARAYRGYPPRQFPAPAL